MEDYMLQLVDAKDVKVVDAKEIDYVIERMIADSKDNYQEISQLMLESTSALSSADGRTKAMASRGFFKEKWDKLTGKDNKLKCAIEKDEIASQYALQEVINRVAEASERNLGLLCALERYTRGELTELRQGIANGEAEIGRVRVALVGFYSRYIEEAAKRKAELEDLQNTINTRCEVCRAEIREEQIVCPQCGSIQRMKMKGVHKEMQNKYKMLSEVMMSSPSTWNVEECWHVKAGLFNEKIARSREIYQLGSMLNEMTSLYRDMEELIKKCRNAEFQIAVVGVLKAGKSMLMNALIGMELASTGLNSKTAALTKFRSSAKGHYVKVSFYKEDEWEKLKRSAKESSRDQEEDSFLKYLERPSIIQEGKKWINHEPVIAEFDDADKFKAEIERWTAADSEEHLFAKEVEVGIDRTMFDMPEEVVFVDTPGLQDPVRYRSRITEQYISGANAVLVAVPIGALTEEGFATITRVFDHAGNKSGKVYIVGTQKDRLQGVDDYKEIIDEWVTKLVEARRYKTRGVARSKIHATSAYIHLCMKKAVTLKGEEFEDESKFPYDDYLNFENYVSKLTKSRRGYPIEQLKGDEKTLEIVKQACEIDKLKVILEKELINDFRNLKIKDISQDFENCKKQIIRDAIKNEKSCKQVAEDSQKNSDEIKARLNQVKKEKVQLEKEKEDLDMTLGMLREFTEQSFMSTISAKGQSEKEKEERDNASDVWRGFRTQRFRENFRKI